MFDVHVLSLPRMIDRNTLIKDSWSGFNIIWHMGYDWRTDDIDRELIGMKISIYHKAKLAIYLGHLKIWRDLVTSGEQGYLIIENDTELLDADRLLEVISGKDFVKCYRPPIEYPDWVGTNCYWCSNVVANRLINHTPISSPDRVIFETLHATSYTGKSIVRTSGKFRSDYETPAQNKSAP